jgi:hypothetical protein
MTHRGLSTDATTQLEALVGVPCWISPVELRSDPAWAPLRGHPLYVQPVR